MISFWFWFWGFGHVTFIFIQYLTMTNIGPVVWPVYPAGPIFQRRLSFGTGKREAQPTSLTRQHILSRERLSGHLNFGADLALASKTRL
jgi:hypothetical protein